MFFNSAYGEQFVRIEGYNNRAVQHGGSEDQSVHLFPRLQTGYPEKMPGLVGGAVNE